MSRTADRTLLASLGFADPDHKDRRHTLACQYLAQPDVAQKVLARCQPPESGAASRVLHTSGGAGRS